MDTDALIEPALAQGDAAAAEDAAAARIGQYGSYTVPRECEWGCGFVTSDRAAYWQHRLDLHETS